MRVLFQPIGFGLLLISWLQPLHILPWTAWHSEAPAFAAAIALAIGSEMRQTDGHTGRQFSYPMASLLFVTIGVVAVIQRLFGLITYFGDALVIALYTILAAYTIAVGYSWARVKQSERYATASPLTALAVILCIGAALSVLIALMQAFQLWESFPWVMRQADLRRPGANMGQPNHLSTLILLGMVSVGYLLESKFIGKLLAFTLALIFVLGVGISESRTGLLSATLLAIWWTWRPLQTISRSAIWGGWSLLMALALLWPGFIEFVRVNTGQSLNLGESMVRTPALRLRIWPQLIEAATMNPWFGWGLGRVSAAHNAVLDHYTDGEPYTYAHNLALDLVIGLGIPGGVLVFGVIVVWLVRRMREVGSFEAKYCLAICIPMAAHSMLEFPFAYAYFLVPTMLAVGYLEGASVSASAVHLPKRWSCAFAMLWVATLVWTGFEYVLVEEDFRVARMEVLRVGKTPVEYNRPSIFLLTQLSAMLNATRETPSPGMSPEQIEALRVAALRFPWTAIQNRYALALALNGFPDEAIRQLKVMRAMFGEKFFLGVRQSWLDLANTKYPQLIEIDIP